MKLLSDNGGEFKNDLMARISATLGVTQLFTSSYNPQCDGMVERFNRTLARTLAAFVSPDQQDWEKWLPMVTLAYNTTVSEATKATPMETAFGIPVADRTLMELAVLPLVCEDTEPQAKARLADMREAVNEAVVEEKLASLQRANKSRVEPMVYHRGDLVWIASHVRLPTGAKLKMAPNWRGPHVVVHVRGSVNVVTRMIGSGEAAVTRHVNNVKPYFGRDGVCLSMVLDLTERENRLAEEDTCEDDVAVLETVTKAQFVVEKVTDMRWRNGSLEFLITWADYATTTWERESMLQCGSLVEAFFAHDVYADVGEDGRRGVSAFIRL